MASITSSVGKPALPAELQPIADRVVAELRLAADKAVAHTVDATTFPLPAEPSSAEAIFLARFEQLTPAQQQSARTNTMSRVEAPLEERQAIYGALAAVDLKTSRSIVDELTVMSLPMPGTKLTMSAEGLTVAQALSPPAATQLAPHPNKPAPPLSSKSILELRLARVKCLEETDGAFGTGAGEDEIQLGVVTVDETGVTRLSDSFDVGSFETDDMWFTSPPRVLAQFEVERLAPYPKAYHATLALAEIDNGGFPDWLAKLVAGAQEEVVKYLTSALGAAAGAWIGGTVLSAIPGVGTVIGVAIGAIVGWCVGALVDVLRSTWNDDIFPVIDTNITIPAKGSTFGGFGAYRHVEQTSTSGGTYELTFDWSMEWAQWRGGGAWQKDWHDLGGKLTSAPAAAMSDTERVAVFARGADNALWHKAYEPKTGWGTWTNLGGALTSAPAAVCWSAERIDCFVRGADDHIWHMDWEGAWSSWDDLGGPFTSGPAAASGGKGRLDIFARGAENQLLHRAFDGNWQSDWDDLGGQLSSAPAAVSRDDSRIDVFARGIDEHVWHRSWIGDGWNAWSDLGGKTTSAPTACSSGPGRVDIFTRGTDGETHHKWWDGDAFSDWRTLGGESADAPAAASNRDVNRILLFTRAPDGRLMHNWTS